MLAKKEIISAVWFLDYDKVPGGIKINRHHRLNRHRDELPECNSEFYLLEDDNRTVIAAVIDGKRVEVVNPQFVFSYGKTEGNE